MSCAGAQAGRLSRGTARAAKRLGERAELAEAAAALGGSAVVDALVGAVQADVGAAAGTAPPAWLPSALVAHTGLPALAFRTLRHHAVLDTAHSVEIVELLDRLDLPPQLRSAVVASALATTDAFGTLLADLVRRPSSPEGPRP